MSLRKLPSGSWNYRQTIDGKSFSITYDHRPTKREIEDDMFKRRKDAGVYSAAGTFKTHAEQYIKDKSNVLSPSTITNYESILRNLSKTFCDARMGSISQVDVQREINHYAIDRSPKSVKNASGFINVVITYFRPELHMNIKLPQSKKVETFIPSDEDVKKLVEAIKGSEYEIPILLGLLGLRRSEAIAITAKDIKGNILTINKAIVVNPDKKFKEKDFTKNVSSTREIYIPDYVAGLIKKQGYAYKGWPDCIRRYLQRTQKRLGIPECTFHALRHYYVSYAHSQGIPDAYIAKSVGHSNIGTTQKIYTHAQEQKLSEMQIKAADFLG